MYNIEGIAFLRRAVEAWAGKPFEQALRDKLVVELGNQHVWGPADIGFTVARDWFESMGARYRSIDTNGDDGAIALDLSAPLPSYMRETADVVTDIGTLEHVRMRMDSEASMRAQAQCLENIHNLCKPGGLMVHELPPVGQWRDHCWLRYTDGFVPGLAMAFNYRVLLHERVKLRTLDSGADYVAGALVRNNTPPMAFLPSALDEIEWREPW